MANKDWAVSDLLKTTADFLGQKGLPSPRLEAELLLSEVLSLSRVALYVNFERILNAPELDAYRDLVRRRMGREPTAYILGRKEFYSLNFKVTKDTLIPRPETERLVDEALLLVKDLNEPIIADVGCGCGAIALSLAKNLKTAKIAATDVSSKALSVARENAESLGLAERIEFLEGDLAAPLSGRSFDLICANLPYVPEGDLKALEPDVVKFEPLLALNGGPDGLSLYRRLIDGIGQILKPGAYLLMEIHPPTLAKLIELFKAEGLAFIRAIPDYDRRDRLALARRPL
jgi:release factor glutamine methyltransferase